MGTAGRNALILLAGYDLSGDLNEWEASASADLKNGTTFSPTTTAKTFAATLRDGTLSAKGFWDVGAGKIETVLESLILAASKSVGTVFPIGAAVGNPMIGLSGDLKARKIPAKIDDLIQLQFDLQSSTGADIGKSLHAFQQETAGVTGTTVDDGASSTNGGAAYLEVTAAGTTMDVAIHHSSDNFAADDHVLGTFSAITAVGGYRLTWTGTTQRYIRFVSLNQTGNFTFACGHARTPA